LISAAEQDLRPATTTSSYVLQPQFRHWVRFQRCSRFFTGWIGSQRCLPPWRWPLKSSAVIGSAWSLVGSSRLRSLRGACVLR